MKFYGVLIIATYRIKSSKPSVSCCMRAVIPIIMNIFLVYIEETKKYFDYDHRLFNTESRKMHDITYFKNKLR